MNVSQEKSTARLNIKLEPELLNWLKSEAKKQHYSVSCFVRRILYKEQSSSENDKK